MLLQTSLTGLSSYWQVPYPRNPFFSGRSHLLTHLHRQLGGKHPVALSQSYGITGLGGIGKTQLALEYAYQHAHDYHAVFWIAAETIDTIYADFTLVAEQLKLLEGEKQDQQRVVKAIHHWLVTHKDWLLIFDNVEDLSLLKSFLPAARQGAVLVTTRLHALAGLAHTLELGAFPLEEALRFLLSRAHIAGPDQSLDEIPPDILGAAQTLVKATDGLPLALDQAGAYLEQTGSTLADYLHLFERHRMRLLAERPAAADHPASVVQTFLLSFEHVEQSQTAAGDLLRLCALLHPDAIPEELIREGTSQWKTQLGEAVSDPFAFEQMMAELLRFSLIKRSSEQRALSLHRLVQAVLLDTMTGSERDQWLVRILTALDLVFPPDLLMREGGEQRTWSQCERLLPHALLCLERADANHDDLILASLAFKAAQYLQIRGRYAEAEPLYQRALHIREQLMGPDHAEVATLLHGLADLSREQGKYVEAEPLYQRALHIRKQLMGPEHIEVATLLNGLAEGYRALGKYAEAEPLYQRAIAIFEHKLGPEHSLVAHPLNNLASLCREQGKYAEAEQLTRRALHIWEQQRGETHPLIAHVLNSLANLSLEQGKYAEAESLYQRALAIFEQQLGETHPDVALALNNLGTLYQEQGKYSEAEPFYRRTLHIWEQQLGEMHPHVAFTLNNLAELHQKQGKYAEAEPLYQRSLHILEQKLGPDNPYVAYPLTGLADVHREYGQYAQAETLYLRALSIREHSLEPHHPDTAETLHGLAMLREMQGNLREAVSLYQRVLSIREQVLGLHHPRTTQTRERLHLVLVTREAVQQIGAPGEQIETKGDL
jgi:tetratricopeptide (TPR) repeat protein